MEKPEKKFVAGAISATIWENTTEREGKQVSYRTISLTRSYKNKDGKWQQTNSFRTTDIPKALLVLNKAYEYIMLRDFSESKGSDIEVEEIKEEEI